MDFHSAARLAQQVYPERVQEASERPVYPHEEYQGTDHRPAMRTVTAGWHDLLGRLARRRALGWLRP